MKKEGKNILAKTEPASVSVSKENSLNHSPRGLKK
jgi:hypothetical protein